MNRSDSLWGLASLLVSCNEIKERVSFLYAPGLSSSYMKKFYKESRMPSNLIFEGENISFLNIQFLLSDTKDELMKRLKSYSYIGLVCLDKEEFIPLVFDEPSCRIVTDSCTVQISILWLSRGLDRHDPTPWGNKRVISLSELEETDGYINSPPSERSPEHIKENVIRNLSWELPNNDKPRGSNLNSYVEHKVSSSRDAAHGGGSEVEANADEAQNIIKSQVSKHSSGGKNLYDWDLNNPLRSSTEGTPTVSAPLKRTRTIRILAGFISIVPPQPNIRSLKVEAYLRSHSTTTRTLISNLLVPVDNGTLAYCALDHTLHELCNGCIEFNSTHIENQELNLHIIITIGDDIFFLAHDMSPGRKFSVTSAYLLESRETTQLRGNKNFTVCCELGLMDM